jgi:uncharacterized OB-fold protein
MSTNAVPAVEGFFDPSIPALLGSRCASCATVFFPAAEGWCRNPGCSSTEFESIELSRRGRIWSYTDAQYQPPEPYVGADPYVPFALAAVELAEEGIVVLGQMVDGVGVDDIAIGDEVELVTAVLYSDDDGDKLVWKWRPLEGSTNG